MKTQAAKFPSSLKNPPKSSKLKPRKLPRLPQNQTLMKRTLPSSRRSPKSRSRLRLPPSRRSSRRLPKKNPQRSLTVKRKSLRKKL